MKNKVAIILSTVMAVTLIQMNAVAVRIKNQTSGTIVIDNSLKNLPSRLVRVSPGEEIDYQLRVHDPEYRYRWAYSTAYLEKGHQKAVRIYQMNQCPDPAADTYTIYMWPDKDSPVVITGAPLSLAHDYRWPADADDTIVLTFTDRQ